MVSSTPRPHFAPGKDSVPILQETGWAPGPIWTGGKNRNEYQEYFLEGEGGRCEGLTTLPPSRADCLEIREPQTPGALRACTGIAVPF